VLPGCPRPAAAAGGPCGRVKAGCDPADVRRVRFSRRAALLVAGSLLLAALPAQSARAESAAQARAAARRAAAEVAALQPRVDAALRGYDQALGGLANSVTRSVAADAAADQAARVADDRRRQVTGRVRALYMAGGPAALYASVLAAGDASDALRRMAYVQRLVQVGTRAAEATTASSTALRARAGTLEQGADAHVVTAAEVALRYAELTAVLGQASATLARLSRRARTLQEAEAAAVRLRALGAAVSRSAADRVARARATGIPADFRALYVAAARTCPGMSWTLLAAVGQVESGHGRNPGTSYAGAQGPMQFMPATFAAYGVDGDHDGRTDIHDPADAIFSAARYLCANGAGRGEKAVYTAVWHYNHADWYVQLVLKIAGQLAARPA
jgi:transglycosylase-like protein with SLT domain